MMMMMMMIHDNNERIELRDGVMIGWSDAIGCLGWDVEKNL